MLTTKRRPKYRRTISSWQSSHGELVAPIQSVSPSVKRSNPALPSKDRLFMKMNQSISPYMLSFNQWIVDSGKTFREPFAERRIVLFIIDALILLAAASIAYRTAGTDSLQFRFFDLPLYWNTALVILGIWWVLSALNDLYEISSSAHIRATGIRLLVIGVMGALLYWTLDLLRLGGLPNHTFIAVFAAIGLPAIWIWRFFFTTLANFFAGEHRVLIIGLGRPGQIISDLLQKADYLNYQVIGFVAAHEAELTNVKNSSINTLGTVYDLPTLLKEHHVNEVVLATQGDLNSDVFQQLIVCQGQGVKISWMPALYEKLCNSVPVEYVDPEWALFAMQGQPIFSRVQLTIKRAIDLAIVLLCLPTFLCLFPLLALLIRLDSHGPIFYRQVRTGRGGKPFSIWKFRTMVTDAEKDGVKWAQQNDSRITRIGRIMRKTRLDELPQILNILKGDMSLVGPRPERPEFIEVLQKEIPYYHTRLMVKPGLTGWAQVSYDYGNTTEDALKKLHYDFYYIRYWSLWLDFYIIFKTIEIVFKLKGM